MLTLTRRLGDGIQIGDDITIVVKEIRSNKSVRISIHAPQSTKIYRTEVYERVLEERDKEDEGAT